MMKKVKLAVVAMIIAAGTLGVFAFNTDANEITTETDTSTTLYEWFDPVTMQPLGIRTIAAQQSLCGTPSTEVCAIGNELDEAGNPTGNQAQTFRAP